MQICEATNSYLKEESDLSRLSNSWKASRFGCNNCRIYYKLKDFNLIAKYSSMVFYYFLAVTVSIDAPLRHSI